MNSVGASLSRRALLAGIAVTAVAGAVAGCSILDPGTTVAPDFFATVEDTTDLPDTDVAVDDDARLVTPGAGLQLTTVSTLGSLPQHFAAKLQGGHTSRLVPPEGYEFLVVGLRGLTPGFFDLDKPTLSVVVGDRFHDLGEPFGAYLPDERRYQRTASGFGVCVAKGAAARIDITDQEKTAKLDLRTGRRVADDDTRANDVFLTRRNVVPPVKPVVWKASIITEPGPGYEAETGELTLTWTFAPDYTWAAPFGTTWAKSGRQWLGLGMTCTAKWTGTAASMNTTADQVCTFVDRFGNRHPAVKEEIDHLGETEGTWVMQFDVPAGADEGEVQVRFDKKLVVHHEGRDVPARFTKRDKDLVIPLKARSW